MAPAQCLSPGGIALYDCGKESRGHLSLCTQGTKAQESLTMSFFFFFFIFFFFFLFLKK